MGRQSGSLRDTDTIFFRGYYIGDKPKYLITQIVCSNVQNLLGYIIHFEIWWGLQLADILLVIKLSAVICERFIIHNRFR